MVTVFRTQQYNNEADNIEFYGLSTDTKPTGKYGSRVIGNGSSFFEMDTQDVYFYDEDSETWK